MDEVAFGRYRLIELLGRGGMGEVWRARDTESNNRMVAIKMMPPYLAADEMFVARFRREADAAAQLNNPHVIPIHNYGEIDGRLYVDMRLIEGRDLQEVLTDGPLEPGRAVRIIEQVANALHAAHKIGLVHRDVKPSNILLDEDDFAYLIDFGIARGRDQTRMTGTDTIIGSWPYMSPERLRVGEVDARSDIYALACVLYECLTGTTPYPGDSFEQQMTAHLTESAPRPSSTRPDIPKQVDEVIATGMAKNPGQRYATTVELANAAHYAITTPLAPPSEPTLLGDAAPPTPAPAPTARQQAADPHLAATQQQQPGWPPVPPPPPADRPPPQTATPSPRPWWRRQRQQVKVTLIGAIVVVLAAAGITGYFMWPSPSPTAQPAPAPVQTVLPFTGLNGPHGVAVDTAGSVYVTDAGNNRVVELTAGSSTPTVLPLTGLNDPNGVAVDTAGSVYVTDAGNNRVVELTAGSSTPTVLPFTGLNEPHGVAVDTAGSVYVTDTGNQRVLKLATGSTTPTVLPFTGLDDYGVAVDGGGNLYVTDTGNQRVLKLATGSTTPTELPFTGLVAPVGVAVDSAGNLYVTEPLEWHHHGSPSAAPSSTTQQTVGYARVVKLAAGSSTQTELPFTGLSGPGGVAVDSAGDVYVTDSKSGHHHGSPSAAPSPTTQQTVGYSRVLELATG